MNHKLITYYKNVNRLFQQKSNEQEIGNTMNSCFVKNTSQEKGKKK